MKRKQLLSLVVVWTLLLWVTNATSSYIHEQDGTISICDPDSNWTKCITMQDKNLWASKSGTTCSSADTWACGNHYQRWNNYWFANPWVNGADAITQAATGTLALWSSGYNHVWYYWITFIKWTSSSKYDYWSDNTPSNHNWLRWWENDTQENNYWYDETNNVALNVENRRWPCGELYHVPSIWEWNQVLKYWAQENGIELEDDGGLKYNYTTLDWLKFQEDFKIPFAGLRYNYDARVYSVGSYADLWSSSRYVGYDNARYFRLIPNEAYADDLSFRADGFSVRCFKDSYLSFPSSEGGDWSRWNSKIIVSIAALNSWNNTCTWENYIFPAISASPTVQTMSLSKKFQCVFWKAIQSSVTLLLSWDLTDENGNVISWENVRLKNPEWTSQPTVLKNGNTAFNFKTFMWLGATLFNKVWNKIWTAEWSGVEIEITVPWWTPDGTYNWTLVLTY